MRYAFVRGTVEIEPDEQFVPFLLCHGCNC